MRPRAKSVIPLDDYKLLITFSNDETKIFDVNPYLKLKPYEQLKNIGVFRTVRIAGLSIEWSTGQDICPDELYFNSRGDAYE